MLIQIIFFLIFKLNKWCDEAGGGIEIVFGAKRPKVPATAIDSSNLYWQAFRDVLINDL